MATSTAARDVKYATASALQHEVAGYLKHKIADEKYSRTQSINTVAEVQLPLHLQSSEGHVDTVEIGHQVENE